MHEDNEEETEEENDETQNVTEEEVVFENMSEENDGSTFDNQSLNDVNFEVPDNIYTDPTGEEGEEGSEEEGEEGSEEEGEEGEEGSEEEEGEEGEEGSEEEEGEEGDEGSEDEEGYEDVEEVTEDWEYIGVGGFGCYPEGQGYWANHPEDWPYAFPECTEENPDGCLCGYSYQDDLLARYVESDTWLMLARQWLAAMLNEAAGADISAVEEEFEEAQDIVLDCEIPEDMSHGEGTDLADVLDEFNNGEFSDEECD